MGSVLFSTAEEPVTPVYTSYYDVEPLVVPTDLFSEISIRPKFEHANFSDDVEVKIFPRKGLRGNGFSYGSLKDTAWKLDECGTLKVKAVFPGEQSHVIAVTYTIPATKWEPARQVTRKFPVYSCHEDLYSAIPLRADFHIHTNLSDGAESPEYVAARYREEGFDFIAVTDHFIYEPSLRAIEKCSRFTRDFKLFPGEEVHLPGNRVHVLNFGGKYSVNALATSNPEKFQKEWQEIAETLPPCQDGTDNHNLRQHAAISEWAFREIRKSGGVSMLCHFAWETNGFDVDTWTSDTLIARHNFDLLEIVSGYSLSEWYSNNLQTSRYLTECAKGKKFAVAGVSDSHGTDTGEYFNWYYTIVLAQDDSLEEISTALKSGMAVAVEAVNGALPRCYGDDRLVDYVTFLLANYFPHHRDLCRPEGALLRAALAGDETAAVALRALDGRIPSWRAHLFPRTV